MSLHRERRLGPLTSVRVRAVDIVSQADGPARSVLVDALHVDRSSTTVEDLTEIPREWLHYAQMCDGSHPVPEDDAALIRHAREERLVPGTGESTCEESGLPYRKVSR